MSVKTAIRMYMEYGEPETLHVLLDYINAAQVETPRQCCGETENLQGGYAGGNLRWLCPRCAAEALDPKR